MKKTIFTSLFVLLCMTSCDFLTQTPKDELTPEDYFKTETDKTSYWVQDILFTSGKV